uniref:Uncharacterized protein n=1 Tax=Coccolithus braarudii TaxID=221442 RepID=A0A7S0LBH4_9EUKA|mmetsp:Transcript_30166/g.64833  ORF Transcript_30166/g.64833 Transcript_30166/m.64833 type:complete len:124 (+) Transcript_30166:89-460(+)
MTAAVTALDHSSAEAIVAQLHAFFDESSPSVATSPEAALSGTACVAINLSGDPSEMQVPAEADDASASLGELAEKPSALPALSDTVSDATALEIAQLVLHANAPVNVHEPDTAHCSITAAPRR